MNSKNGLGAISNTEYHQLRQMLNEYQSTPLNVREEKDHDIVYDETVNLRTETFDKKLAVLQKKRGKSIGHTVG